MGRWHWIRRNLCMGTLFLTGILVVAGALAGPALAKKPVGSPGGGGGNGGGGNGGGSTATTTGYDISWPQCGSSLPTSAAFAIVGVNDGLANDGNPCLGTELTWAGQWSGLSSPYQPGTSVYINTADPGPIASDWPTSGTGSDGTCNGNWSQACAWLYGEKMGQSSYDMVTDVTGNSFDPTLASSGPWWLDIETGNSWATSGSITYPPATTYEQVNIAAIQGFIAGLKAGAADLANPVTPDQPPADTEPTGGATGYIGIYTTISQWNSITGLSPTTTRSEFSPLPPAWVPGARTLKGATSNCNNTSFTGALPVLTQYSSKGLDADLRCPNTSY